MQFTYVLSGWEGSAADSRVLRDAITRKNGLKVPHGYYYLVDAGYTNCEGFLAPYRGQRYHLNEWKEGRVNMASNPSGESYNPKRPVKNKHQWSAIEDAALIEALMQLNNAGDLRNKNEKGFRPGHGLKLQQMLEVSLPGYGIKAKPHIESRKKIVTAENSVWDEYIKTHGDAEQFRYKSLTYYEELSIIFGGDRASGKDAQVPADIVEELDKVAVENDESIGVNGDYASYAEDFIFGSSEENSKPQRRKTESTKDLSRVIREATVILGEELNNARAGL
ncbi:hypothetical protein ZIOFF_071298 [Zingiber officinale]|uniref:DDE Tnp4 domain-containing protein n=1 Tax=Zingiber officinale TaxID=94328 RepID=A0A8J5ETI1_ZINOF|nr:hypothetical protein ZIOFF_071298 [Zingiber officinale]